ncbi:MAG: 2Fe-2S iron-sulfur cluster-binding protein, partial [Hyphomonadaceae bacterium]
MKQPLRLAAGGAVDRAKPITFHFDGRAYEGFEGDTLASALLANDVRILARSFKYHRPRGLLTAGPEEPNALVTLGAGAEPNARATTTWLTPGLVARGQNAWPSVRFDLMALNGLFAPLFVAGFYYKTFKWPSAFWEKLYEPLIRRAAGLGALSGAPDPTLYDRNHAFCDVLVIGAGPAGLAAALAAGRAGARVLLVEEDRALGGRLLSDGDVINERPAASWITQIEAELKTLANVRVLSCASVFGLYDGAVYGAFETPQNGAPTLWKIAAERAILATGAHERPMVFSGNDAPGIMLASAGATYAQRFAVAPGRSVAVFTASDSGHGVAGQLQAFGVNIAALVDSRAGGCVIDTRGRSRLQAVKLRNERGVCAWIDADCLLMAGGWAPNIGLASHLGHRPAWSGAHACFVMEEGPAHLRIIGAAAARWTLPQCLNDGAEAGAAAAADLGFQPKAAAAPIASEALCAFTPLVRAPQGRRKAFIDFQHDVTAADIELAAREGYRSVEHAKRYTTLGMATDQGKTSNLNGYAFLGAALGKAPQEMGAVLSRPPHTPVPIGAFAGGHRETHFRPARRTPTHDWAAAHGAVFVDAGQWKRAQYFPRPDEADWLQTVSREVRAVRAGVGLCDVSTLGKIDVQGPDAGVFLDRLYASRIGALAPGRARYGLMLREDGFVLDDGTLARLAEDRFFVTTTTANAARVMAHMEYCRQILWPELDVQTCSATEQWAQIAVAGPHARVLLQRLLPDLDLGAEAFPFMACCEHAWRCAPIRLFRISFSGELAYEIATPAQFGEALMDALFTAGG